MTRRLYVTVNKGGSIHAKKVWRRHLFDDTGISLCGRMALHRFNQGYESADELQGEIRDDCRTCLANYEKRDERYFPMPEWNKSNDVPQPQGAQVAKWYEDNQPTPYEMLLELAQVRSQRDELLGALKDCSAQLKHALGLNCTQNNVYAQTNYGRAHKKARAAIAKAKGEAGNPT